MVIDGHAGAAGAISGPGIHRAAGKNWCCQNGGWFEFAHRSRAAPTPFMSPLGHPAPAGCRATSTPVTIPWLATTSARDELIHNRVVVGRATPAPVEIVLAGPSSYRYSRISQALPVGGTPLSLRPFVSAAPTGRAINMQPSESERGEASEHRSTVIPPSRPPTFRKTHYSKTIKPKVSAQVLSTSGLVVLLLQLVAHLSRPISVQTTGKLGVSE